MLKKISNINGAQELSNTDQKSIKGGFGFPGLPGNDCCACVFVPAGQQFPILITQSCDVPCPTNGSLEYQDTGC